MATKIRAIAAQPGTVPILARTSHGRDLSTTSAKESVKHRVEEVLAVTASEERSPLRRAQPLYDEKDADDRKA
jgi:hypothetical protein